jgi:hypothetical protein
VRLASEFVGKLTTLIGFLRRQYNLISEMRTECPKFSHVRWLSLHGVLKWLCNNRIRVPQYLEGKKIQWVPALSWWLFLHVLNFITEEANKTLKELQSLSAHLIQKSVKLHQLCKLYYNIASIKGPIDSGVDINLFGSGSISENEKYFVSDDDVLHIIHQIKIFQIQKWRW